MSINDAIYDRIVSHLTDVRLYEEGVQLQTRRIFSRHRTKLTDLLKGNVRTDLVKEANRFNKELTAHTTTSMLEFSTSQLDFHTNNLHKEVKKFYEVKRPKSKELLAEITGPNIKGVKTISENIRNISAGELVRIQSKVKAGLALNKSPKEIIADVMKTTKLSEVQATTLTRTSITSVQNAALSKVMDDNKDIIKGYMFTAILDSRTSPICSHHNGEIYKINDNRYLPPLHWNCRSSLTPVLKSRDELLKELPIRVNKKELEKLNSLELNGKAPAVTNFGDWLKKQSMAIQVDILGDMEKVNLFKAGGLTVKDFTTAKGKGLSISALRRKAALVTSNFPTRQQIQAIEVDVKVSKPSMLVNSPQNSDTLRQLFINDSEAFNQSLSLTDFKGTSLVGKQASRRRVGNEFDERNFTADALTGEIKNNNLYDPDYNLYQERIDFMRNSKIISRDEKDFIENFVNSLEDKVSLNQQTVVTENLRVVFERYSKDKKPWGDFSSVVRAENRFSVQNVSRLLDTRSRQRSELFVKYITSNDKPQVQIMGKYYDLDKLQASQLADQRFIDNWRSTTGTKLAKRVYFSGRAPMSAYFRKIIEKYPSREKIIKSLRKNNPTWAKLYDLAYKEKVPTDAWIVRTYANKREAVRRILDLEFFYAKKKPTSIFMNDKVLNTITKATKLVASGQSTDYDALAINIGKLYAEDLGELFPWTSSALSDYHKQGSILLDMMKEQNLIRVQFRGKLRRGVIDVDTGRASGGWGNTISREVIVIDKDLLKLQEAERRVVISRRLGVTSDRDRLYVKAGKKTYVDARGNDTGLPIISSSKFSTFNANQIDRDFSSMLNHVMSVEYEVDKEFFNFMDDLVRFRDPRGNAKYWDSLNEFRHEILRRGEAGYGLMATAKYHLQRGKPFRTLAYIDSRGRVYHRGYLTPTGGEVVRPFMNTAKALNINTEVVDELRIQLGAMIGPATEALSQEGRRAIFLRNQSKVVELGELLLSTTQRDRRIRDFLEHPLIRGLEGSEVPKVARLAMEYARINRHVKGNFLDTKKLSTYQTKLMIENDASSSGAQIIGLSTGDRSISLASNVLPTIQKNRLYDLIAMDTVNDPEFLAIPALRNSGLTWEDLAKAAKAQNMVHFYGAGAATKTYRIADKLEGILEGKGFTVVTKDSLNNTLRLVDNKIKLSTQLSAKTTVEELKAFRAELIDLINKNEPVGSMLLKEARDIHPDVADFVEKLTNTRKGLVGPKDFSRISEIMSKNLSARAPIADNFIKFWKEASTTFVSETNLVDIPWVTFDNKIMTQRYRPRLQERIEFKDPVTGRKISNIYETAAENGKLLGKSSITDARIGLGVNGNHSNDAAIVRQFHLWGKKNNIPTATIHDAFFTNIAVANKAKAALRGIYGDAVESRTVEKTLKEMLKQGLSKDTYNKLVAKAKELGLIDPPNRLTRKEIIAPIPEGYDFYGVGP